VLFRSILRRKLVAGDYEAEQGRDNSQQQGNAA
jgi:hypothetical protein